MQTPQFNLLLAWAWLWLGFASGMVLGLFFHEEKWLGGYASFKRRLYRLAHISFFGLGAVNLAFYFTARSLSAPGPSALAGWALALGAVSMPVCCLLMAHRPRLQPLFAVPVLSLLFGGALTVAAVARSASVSTSPGAAAEVRLSHPENAPGTKPADSTLRPLPDSL